MTFTLVTVLLLSSPSWISVSASEFHTVEAESGETVTLLCSNYTSSSSHIMWFRAVKKLKPRCISTILNPSEPASVCEGFNQIKYEATSNGSTLFLRIKRVDSSDSGLYFCGSYMSTSPLIVGATYLEVQDMFEGIVKLISLILGALTVFLTMVVIGLVVKLKKQHKAPTEELNPPRSESESSEDFEYPPVILSPKPERDLMHALARELETRAAYTDSANNWNCSSESD